VPVIPEGDSRWLLAAGLAALGALGAWRRRRP
jgi:MYXO-CTERM domain-containing protein